MIILIDNGHGADTKGKRSPDGELREAIWAREMAYDLMTALQKRNIEARMITPEMQDIALQTRVARINKVCTERGANNVLLVSLHLNASGDGRSWGTARGFSAFVCKTASRRSKYFAELLTREAEARDMMGNRAMPKNDENGCRYWTWSWTDKDIYILKKSNCPAVLTESGFMDNAAEKVWLQSKEGRARIIAAHVSAIIEYIKLCG